AHMMSAKRPDRAMERAMGKAELGADIAEHAVPTVDPFLAVGDVVLSQGLVEGSQLRHLAFTDVVADDLGHHAKALDQPVVVGTALLLAAALQPGGEVVG